MPKENEQLETFLAEVQQDAQARAQEAPQEAPPESMPPPTPEKPVEAPKEAPKPATELEDDEPEQVEDQNGLVPRQALDRERHRRVQWKEKFARAEALAEERQKRLDVLEKAKRLEGSYVEQAPLARPNMSALIRPRSRGSTLCSSAPRRSRASGRTSPDIVHRWGASPCSRSRSAPSARRASASFRWTTFGTR